MFQESFFESIKQGLIDHNHFFLFLFSWFALALFQVIFYTYSDTSFFALIFPDISIRPWKLPIPEHLGLSMILSSLPSVLLSAFIGYIMDELYFNQLKSSKQKYNKAIENLEGRFFIGLWITLIAIVLLAILMIKDLFDFLPLLIGVAISYSALFWNHFLLGGGRPSDIPYFKLLSTKKILDNHVKGRFLYFFPSVLLISTGLMVLWVLLASSFLHPEYTAQEVILTGGVALSALIFAFNGIFLMYHYNWNYIKKILFHGESPKMDDSWSNY